MFRTAQHRVLRGRLIFSGTLNGCNIPLVYGFQASEASAVLGQVQETLQADLSHIFERRYKAEEYELLPPRFTIIVQDVEKAFGTALASICFTSYVLTLTKYVSSRNKPDKLPENELKQTVDMENLSTTAGTSTQSSPSPVSWHSDFMSGQLRSCPVLVLYCGTGQQVTLACADFQSSMHTFC